MLMSWNIGLNQMLMHLVAAIRKKDKESTKEEQTPEASPFHTRDEEKFEILEIMALKNVELEI